MTSLFSSLSPIPSFPAYTGPFYVGTIDVEIPVTDLPSHAPCPDPSISTILYRVFYPCEVSRKKSDPVHWIPDPQKEHVAAFGRFLGGSPRLSTFFSQLYRFIYYTTIPALRAAPILSPSTTTGKWPCMVFSHGLGGSRNGYSQILGMLASHGLVVFAPEHRDGSAPTAFIQQDKLKLVEYRSISHKPSKEVEDARDAQLRIRLWELGLTYDSMIKMDKGELPNSTVTDHLDISGFAGKLDVSVPGKVNWGGHSFGAVTVVQLLKSVFYHSECPGDKSRMLYKPAPDSPLISQISPSSSITLLDLWAMPLRSESMRWLWDKPLPCYTADRPGASNVLAVLSEAFFKWKGNLVLLKRIISEKPANEVASASRFVAPPHVFYPQTSAHLSQSDFGILFPWLIKRALKAQEPERTLLLNTRASLEMLRQNGTELADTTPVEMEEASPYKPGNSASGHANGHPNGDVVKSAGGLGQDRRILETTGSLRAWVPLTLEKESQPGEAAVSNLAAEVAPADAVMNIELGVENGDNQGSGSVNL